MTSNYHRLTGHKPKGPYLCFLLLYFCGIMAISCSHSLTVVKTDPIKKKLEIQSTSDSGSALPDMKSEPRINKTIAKLKEEIKKTPKNTKPYLNLAQLYLIQERYDLATSTCQNALKIDLKNKSALKIMAQIYLRKQDIDMATIILWRLGGNNSKDSQIINMLAMIALLKERRSEALFLFKKALKINPNDVAARMNLGVLYLHYRQLSNSAIQFERVLKIMPKHNDALLHLAIIEANRSNHDKALEIYQAILSINTSPPPGPLQHGCIGKKT